jgi:hypothetical protein
VAVGELHENEGVLRTGVGRVGCGPVVEHAHVGDDHFAFSLRDGGADGVLDARGQFLGLLDAQAGGCAQANPELARVRLRKQFRAEPGEQQQRHDEQRRDADEHEPAEAQDELEHRHISAADGGEPAFVVAP